MKDNIVSILKKENKALSVYEINDLLELNSSEDLQNLLKELDELEKELIVYHTNKDKYMLFDNSHLKTGRLIVNKKGFGFVDIEGSDDIYVASNNMNGAIHGDIVIAEITSKKGFDLEGRILKIVKRDLKNVVGTIIKDNNKLALKLDDDKLKIIVEIPSDKIGKLILEGQYNGLSRAGNKYLKEIMNKKFPKKCLKKDLILGLGKAITETGHDKFFKNKKLLSSAAHNVYKNLKDPINVWKDEKLKGKIFTKNLVDGGIKTVVDMAFELIDGKQVLIKPNGEFNNDVLNDLVKNFTKNEKEAFIKALEYKIKKM